MTYKTFYNNCINKDFKDIKILNKNFYPKSLIRNEILTKKEVKTIDNFKFIKHSICDKNLKEGDAFLNKDSLLINKNNPNLRIWTNLGFSNPLKNILINHNKSLKEFTNPIKKKPSIVLRSVKGGYWTYSSGLCGFLPKSQYNSAIKNLKKNKKFFNKAHKFVRFFPLRVLLKLTKMSIQPNNFRNNFSNSKMWIFANKLNLIFINRKQIKKKYENTKIKKNTRK